jgi:hypothetical protein
MMNPGFETQLGVLKLDCWIGAVDVSAWRGVLMFLYVKW